LSDAEMRLSRVWQAHIYLRRPPRGSPDSKYAKEHSTEAPKKPTKPAKN